MNLTSYLFFNGEAEEAANYYASLLDGKIEGLHRYDTRPPVPGMPVPDACKQFILHCSVTFSGGAISMADILPDDLRNFDSRGYIMLTLSCDSIAQAERIYTKLAENAQQIMYELGEIYFAKRYAEVVDRYGVSWAILFEEN